MIDDLLRHRIVTSVLITFAVLVTMNPSEVNKLDTSVSVNPLNMVKNSNILPS